jgi:hypothetical protein
LNWTGTISPTVNGGSNVPNLKLTVCRTGGFKISGYAINAYDETGIEGVLISASTGENDTTDEYGYYELTFTGTWSGTITPDKTGWTFNPNYMEYINVSDDVTDQIFPGTPVISAQLDLSSLWMYQNLPGQTSSTITADAAVIDDPAGNSGYTCYWEFEPPGDLPPSCVPVMITGGGTGDWSCMFAAQSCDTGCISDSGQTFKVRVQVVGNDYGNSGTAEQEFAIALLGDVDNSADVTGVDRTIINAFWRTGSAGPYTLKDCDLDGNGIVDGRDRSIANSIWRGFICSNSVNSPCPLR